jgi:endonuclease-3
MAALDLYEETALLFKDLINEKHREVIENTLQLISSFTRRVNPMSDIKQRALKIHKTLLDVFGEPIWRNQLPAIDELVSTILSQNTNDVNRDRAFEALRARFPTWEIVRDANETDVIDAIRPAGLGNQKGPRIQQVLHAITKERGSLNLDFLAGLPTEEARAWLTKFNGVGPKTAAIVYASH